MSLHTYLERLRYIDDLIRRKATGDARSLSGKLHLSRSRTLEFLNEMKDYGFPIEYSRRIGSYFYREDGQLVKDLFEKATNAPGFQSEELSRDDLKKIIGGKGIFFDNFLQSDYTGPKDLTFALKNKETNSKNNSRSGNTGLSRSVLKKYY